MKRRKGSYDIDDAYLWFSIFLRSKENRLRWKYEPNRNKVVTFSDKENKSLISFDIPHSETFNQKENYATILGGEPFVPESIVINLETSPIFSPKVLKLMERGLWFVKKAGVGIGGGYDVKPIMFNGNFQPVVEAIKQLNQNEKYRRNLFILQKGVERPLLTASGQKLDLRIYMLVTGNPIKFYLCKIGDIRNTVSKYDGSTNTESQITNISQNKKFAKNFGDISTIYNEKTSWYKNTFPKIMKMSMRIAEVYSVVLKSSSKQFFSLIGLDVIIDRDTYDPYLVEMNRRPTVYQPDEAMEYGYSSSFFMKDVAEIGLNGRRGSGIFIPLNIERC